MEKKLLVLLAVLLFIPCTYAASYDIVVVREDLPVDSMVAQVYTQSADIPLIAVTKGGLSRDITIELQGYSMQGYKKALIIGGEDAIPLKVENELNNLNFTVTRLWDWSRYGTAARVAVSLWEKTDTVVVTPGDTSGNLVSAARIAIDYKSPLLLTETNALPEETRTAIGELGASRIILIGNVSEDIRDELSQLGGLQQTKFAQVALKEEPDSKGLFITGIIIGGLIIFLVSSLFSIGILKRKKSD